MSYYEAKYIGPDLAALFDQTPAHRAAQRMASTGGDRLHAAIAENTPVRTGNLRTSWYREPTVPESHGSATAYVSRVRTDVDYAPYVNYGTGLFGPKHAKYLIEPHPPKRFLSWIDPATRRRVFYRQVWHPGSPGAHMIQYGAGLVEGLANEILLGDLEVFKREMEAQAIQAQGRVSVR